MTELGMLRPRLLRAALLIAAGVITWAALAVPVSAVAAEDAPGGSGIVIDITDDSPTPTPTPSSTAGVATPVTQGTQTGSGGTSGGTGSGSPSTPGGAGSPDSIPVEPTSSLPGKPVALAVGGISASIAPTFGVDGGSATFTVVVRNSSSETFDASAKFVVTNLFGATIGEEDGIAVGPLEPDAARTVTATFDDLGQSVFVRGDVTVTPPESVGGIDLEPVTRDTLVFVPPLFALSVIAAAGAIGWTSWWLVGRSRRDALAAASVARAGA